MRQKKLYNTKKVKETKNWQPWRLDILINLLNVNHQPYEQISADTVLQTGFSLCVTQHLPIIPTPFIEVISVILGKAGRERDIRSCLIQMFLHTAG